MKKLFILTLALFNLILPAQSTAQSSTKDTLSKTQTQSQNSQTKHNQAIWIVTDIHHLSPSLHDKDGTAIQHIRNTSAGKDVDYATSRLEALLYAIEKEQPSDLIVSGDLTLNGEWESMQELAHYFTEIEARGTQVWVTPGNHDLYNDWARKFEGDDFVRTKSITAPEFAELFGPFGFDQALSLDDASLSYLAQLANGQTLVMIDTNIYTFELQRPLAAGDIRQETYTWLENQMQSLDQTPLVVLHHNSLDHFEFMNASYTIKSSDQLQALLAKYHIPLTFSGHIHTQRITTFNGLTDIVTGAFSSYPSNIGQVTIDDNQLHYQAFPLPLNEWATVTGQTDDNLQDFEAYMREVFDDSSRKFAFAEMIEGGWYEMNNPMMDDVAQYMAELNRALFSGVPSDLTKVFSQEKLAEIESFVDQHASSFFKKYLNLVTQQSEDYTKPHTYVWK